MDTNHPLRSWRRQNRKTLVALASDAGVVPSHLSQIETGKSLPSLDLASKLAGITGLAIEAFVAASTGASA